MGVSLEGQQLFFSHPSARRPRAGSQVSAEADRSRLQRDINPGKVFDLVLPLEQVADGYRAMDERRAIKTLLQP